MLMVQVPPKESTTVRSKGVGLRYMIRQRRGSVMLLDTFISPIPNELSKALSGSSAWPRKARWNAAFVVSVRVFTARIDERKSATVPP
jgi:hypothetical protein